MPQVTSPQFKTSAHQALNDAALQRSLAKFKGGFAVKRAEAAARLPEFEALRDNARDIKNHVLQHLDYYLEKFEQQVVASGGGGALGQGR